MCRQGFGGGEIASCEPPNLAFRDASPTTIRHGDRACQSADNGRCFAVEVPERECAMSRANHRSPSRRSVLASLAVASFAAPYVWPRRAAAAQQLVVRTPGGAYDDVKRRTVYEPFQRATGIEIVPVAATVSKLLAMFKSGQMEIDLVDTGDDVLLQLERAGALMPLAYKEFKRTNPDDIDPVVKRENQVGSFVYAMVMGFHTSAYPKGKEPKSWKEFWDIKAFPGPRSMADMASGAPDLEFALIADGVPMDKLYPLDIERAFKSLSRVKPAVAKFWDTGALSAQMLADKEVVLGTIWSTRLGVAIDKGAPLGAQWNQNAVLAQAYGIPKGSRNVEGAKAFIDFSLSPEIQSAWMAAYKAIPVNQKAYSATAPELLDPENKLPWTKSKGFVRDIEWWAENRSKVNELWSKWVIQ
jgi:putative spermidine/putrescine transport system substrate-binding protein